jgi:hypothetical protein
MSLSPLGAPGFRPFGGRLIRYFYPIGCAQSLPVYILFLRISGHISQELRATFRIRAASLVTSLLYCENEQLSFFVGQFRVPLRARCDRVHLLLFYGTCAGFDSLR